MWYFAMVAAAVAGMGSKEVGEDILGQFVDCVDESDSSP
jgi:hypothetical protein